MFCNKWESKLFKQAMYFQRLFKTRMLLVKFLKPHKPLILLAYSHGRTLMYLVAEAFKEYSSADDDSSAVHTWSPLY